MTRERAKELLPMIQAWTEGRAVQCRSRRHHDGFWSDNIDPAWADDLDYRIKPEPREWWINVYPAGASDFTFLTRHEADKVAASHRIACIKVREVME